ncbi:uncharacterized protein BJX67DRAFT_26665 [Aspergillus lucknowensis]|uniref:Uncharacterized protein n=1 Tax=Aspergillus lucknowensis TaxID=176173 RepID=A0ABR4LXY1_9EURO
MPSTRTRPIEKFAKATSKCAVEVSPLPALLRAQLRRICADGRRFAGGGIWKVHCCRLSRSAQRHVCQRVYEVERLLSGKINFFFVWPQLRMSD